MFNLVEKLIPKKGFLWRIFPGTMKNFLDALNEEPKRIQESTKTIVRESNPGTAIDTQQEWYQTYGMPFDPSISIEQQQAETLERFTSLGGQDIVYLQDQIDLAGLAVTLIENAPPPDPNECGPAECGVAECWGDFTGPEWIFYYYVIGNPYIEKRDYGRLDNLLERLTPAHLTPILFVQDPLNECGPAECGVSFCDGDN